MHWEVRRTLKACPYFSVIFSQEPTIEEQPPGMRIEPAEEPDTNGEQNFGINLMG